MIQHKPKFLTLLSVFAISLISLKAQTPPNPSGAQTSPQIEDATGNSFKVSTTNLPPNQQQITIPINVISLQFEGAKSLSSTWGELESLEIVSQINQIYKQYGIVWKLNKSKQLKINSAQYQEVNFQESLKSFSSKLSRAFIAPGSGAITGSILNTPPTLYVIKTFPKGADEVASALPSLNSAIFAEKSDSKGKGSPSILAHELAHLLGLTDIPVNGSNLMSIARPKGIGGTKLYSHQQALIRKNASKLSKVSVLMPNQKKQRSPQDLNNTNETKNTPTIFRQLEKSVTY